MELPSTVNDSQRYNAYIEKYYYNDTNFIEIAIPTNGRPVGMFISGGVDSALVCYLLAKTVKKYNTGTKIYPITTEFMARPFNIRHSWSVLRKIEELLDITFEQHLVFPMPNHSINITDEDKKVIMSDNLNRYFKHYNLKSIFNGLTANPPVEEMPDNLYGHRQVERDDMDLVLRKLEQHGMQYPLLFTHKRQLAYLYEKFDLLDSLFPLTRSCEAESEESLQHTKTCYEVRSPGTECWWCREREYGFKDYRPKDFINTSGKVND